MSITDLKHILQKYEFPECAKEALIRTEQVLVGRGAPLNQQLDVVMDIIAEFVFFERDRHSGRRGSELTPPQLLQLIDILCDYLTSCANEIIRNTIFLSIFGGSESLRRLKILSILASMAVAASNTPVLVSIGVWLQQMGCSSTQSLHLAENIVRDHFCLNTSNQAALRSLPTTVPQFVSNFITAVTELYNHDAQGKKKLPPKNLLEVVTVWICTNPSLCMSAQLNPPALPSGVIPMAAVTPLVGLIHWCALAPLFVEEETDIELAEDTVPFKKIKLDIEAKRQASMIKQVTPSESELYTQLHLVVLNCLQMGHRSHGSPKVVNAQHLATIFPVVYAYADQVLKRGGNPATDDKLQNCLDRIGQAIQVALANSCVYGDINTLLATLDTLPENRLLLIIIRTQHQMLAGRGICTVHPMRISFCMQLFITPPNTNMAHHIQSNKICLQLEQDVLSLNSINAVFKNKLDSWL